MFKLQNMKQQEVNYGKTVHKKQLSYLKRDFYNTYAKECFEVWPKTQFHEKYVF